MLRKLRYNHRIVWLSAALYYVANSSAWMLLYNNLDYDVTHKGRILILRIYENASDCALQLQYDSGKWHNDLIIKLEYETSKFKIHIRVEEEVLKRIEKPLIMRQKLKKIETQR